MFGELVPCGGGDPIPLLKPKLLVGRRSRCDIALDFPNVSSHHCELEFLNGYWFVRDLGSRNGIKVNGARCDSKFLLPGDTLSIAKHQFEVQYAPQADGPPPENDEDPFSRSLMEKAGLTRARDDSTRSARPVAKPPAVRPPSPSSGPRSDDDVAMDYLSDEA